MSTVHGSRETETHSFTAPVLRHWKTSVAYSLLGVVVSVLVGFLVEAVPVLFLPIWAITSVFYAAVVYPSYFSDTPKATDNNSISFMNFFFGGVIFGSIWNSNLTNRTKGISYIVFAILTSAPLIIIVLLLLV